MNKKTLTLGLGAALLGISLIAPKMSFAYRGDPGVLGPNYSEQKHEAMTEAFNNNDYNAWKQLVQSKGRVAQVVNESNFARFAEMHKLMLEGKTDEANQIIAELGLGLRDGSGFGQGNGYGKNR